MSEKNTTHISLKFSSKELNFFYFGLKQMAFPIEFCCKHFSELSNQELYKILALRIEVFAIEQNCIYQDADGKDYDAWHIIGRTKSEEIIAYARLLPKGVAYTHYASIGRVVSKPSHRGLGIGKQLLEKTLAYAQIHLKDEPIKISAQSYLKSFYKNYGFVVNGNEYLEDGIPHIGMILKSKKTSS